VLPGAEGGVELIETHISWVLLAGEHAWKLKKPLDLGFLDFSTLDKRRAACEAELRLNRRTAPEVYEAVVAITGTREAPRVDGEGEAIDWLVRMRRFPQSALFTSLLDEGRLEPALFDRLARHVADFHAAAATARPGEGFGDAEAVRFPVRQNFAQVRARIDDEDMVAVLAAVEAWAETQFDRLRGLFDARLAAGRVRECHGDLHLGNLILIDAGPRAFDGIEFNPALRWIDVIADVAFLVMDLQARGRTGLGWRFLNAWLERSGDYEGLAVLPWYLCYRAMVRTKVAAIRATQLDGEARAASVAECRRYLALAAAYTRPGAPLLLIASGVSGAGKTSQSQPLVEARGLIRLRADVERKRLFGLAPEAASGSAPNAGLYTAEASVRTYARLAALARAVTAAGFPVLVDATFLKRAQRDAFRALAAERALPFAILAFEAPAAIVRERVRRRAAAGQDASEADEAVLARQLAGREPLAADEAARALTIDTTEAPDWAALLPRLDALAARGEGGRASAG
jgi:aminoglycoside phosphotransferase family enzyme/predicted kinase